MSGRNIQDFFSDPEAFDALNEEDKARLLAGESLEGETDATTDTEGEAGESQSAEGGTAEESSATPAAANPEEGKKEEAEPVVLAKDGSHTIPYSELEAARERARLLEQEVLALKSHSDSQHTDATKANEAEQGAAAESNEDKLLRLRREEREAMYAGDTDQAEMLGKEADALNRLIAKEEMRAETSAQEAERRAKEEQDRSIADALARANALVERYPFLNPGAPTANQTAIDLVVAQRDRLISQGVAFGDAIEKAVDMVAPLFDKSGQTTDADVAKKAAEAISRAKNTVATSLSQAPSGSRPLHDEGEMLRNMDASRLAQTLESKSPEEIMRIMAKAL